MSNILQLINETDGKEYEFEFLDLIEYELEKYIILLPIDEGETSEVVILKVKTTANEKFNYISVDEDILKQCRRELTKKEKNVKIHV